MITTVAEARGDINAMMHCVRGHRFTLSAAYNDQHGCWCPECGNGAKSYEHDPNDVQHAEYCSFTEERAQNLREARLDDADRRARRCRRPDRCELTHCSVCLGHMIDETAGCGCAGTLVVNEHDRREAAAIEKAFRHDGIWDMWNGEEERVPWRRRAWNELPSALKDAITEMSDAFVCGQTLCQRCDRPFGEP